MRIAVISDIHGDLDSLRRVLTAIDRAATEQIWCLDDIVGLGATAPAEVVDLVRDRCTLALTGNHDRWVTGQLSLSMLPLPRQRAQLQSQHRVLSNEQLTWLAALPPRVGLTTSSSGTAAARTQSPAGSQARKTRRIISPASKPGSGSSGTPTDR